MTTELVLAQPHSPALVQDLTAWAESAHAAANIATSLVKTSFVPPAFRGKPEEATAAILAGVELGLSPMAALRSFDIIQGVSAARAITLRAVVQSAGHEIWTEETTPSRAIVCGQRQGSSKVERSIWTLDRARQLQLTGKDNWKKQPQAMLLARATAECARLVAADAILGIPYSAEELEDAQTIATIATSRTRNVEAPKATQRRLAAAPEPEEPALEEQPAEEPQASPPVPITKAQLTKLHVLLQEAAFTDRELALEFYADTTGRPVESSKDLTKEEASAIIERLVALGTAGADEHPADEAAAAQEPVEGDEQATLDGEAQQ